MSGAGLLHIRRDKLTLVIHEVMADVELPGLGTGTDYFGEHYSWETEWSATCFPCSA